MSLKLFLWLKERSLENFFESFYLAKEKFDEKSLP